MTTYGPFLATAADDVMDGEYGSLSPLSSLLADDGQYASFSEIGAGSLSHDAKIQLTLGGDNKANGDAISDNTTQDNVTHYGGASDLWGVSLSPSQVNDSGFGVLVQLSGGAAATRNSIKLTGFGFSVPSEKTVLGVKLDCKWHTTVAPQGEDWLESVFFDCATLTVYTD